jgi:hypothetical protein
MSYLPNFPDVPFAAGVPPVLRSVVPQDASAIANSALNIALGASQQAVTGIISNAQLGALGLVSGAFGSAPSLLTAHSPLVFSQAIAGQWGIFDQGGTLVLEPDSFLSLDYRHEWRIANYPMELGAFQSYNKVQLPYENRVMMCIGGTVSDRSEFLDTLEDIAGTTDLYNIITPDTRYLNANVEGINYRRTATQGNGLLTVEINFLEIRTTATSTFTNTASPSGALPVNVGTVQPVPLTGGNNATFSNIASAVTGGSSLVGAFNAQSVGIPNLLPPSITAPVLSALTPINVGIAAHISLASLPISASVRLQAAALNFIH